FEKFGGLPGCTEDVLKIAYQPGNDFDFPRKLYNRLKEEREISITSPYGTNLQIEINPEKYNLVISDGRLVKGQYRNPIPAEVFTYPVNADGVVYISNSIALFRSELNRDGHILNKLRKTPLILIIKGGHVVDIRCGNPQIEKFMWDEIFERDRRYGSRIGEIGFPANKYLLSQNINSNPLIAEKGRVHLAHGDCYKDMTGCSYESHVHNDCILDRVNIHSLRTGKPIMKNNIYTF
ncbi:MAG: hypothetical protein GXO64_02110, partial [Candidatus Micrarchaeota archaeon]|nr:hypothetical protein [Candidatus Micrarchaeota archaeon]